MALVSNTPLPSFGSGPSALDFSHLNALKRGALQGGATQERSQAEIARQFEAIFIQMLLKQARQVSEQMPSFYDSPATRMAQSMFDEQAALSMADPGIGLSDALLAQMRAGAGGSGLAADAIMGVDSAGKRAASGAINNLIDSIVSQRGQLNIASAIRGAPEHIRSFVDRMAPAATQAARASGVPAKLILSQAALESGWGEREIRHADGSTSHNLFGIKAGAGWQGKSVAVTTTEYQDGSPVRLSQKFRAYDSYAESFADYARLVGQSERYSAVRGAPTAEAAAQRIQRAGYATDPQYAQKLISIMAYFK